MDILSRYDLTPCPGRAFVAMEPNWRDIEGMIFVPQTVRRPHLRVGLCIALTGYPRDRKSMIYERGKLVARHAWAFNDACRDMLNKQVIVSNARQVKGWIFEVRLEFLEAYTDKQATIKAIEEGVPRCLRCKSKGEGNILLDPAGYCPECGMNVLGQRKKDRSLSLSGELEDYLGDDHERFRIAHGVAKDPNRIISFGQMANLNRRRRRGR